MEYSLREVRAQNFVHRDWTIACSRGCGVSMNSVGQVVGGSSGSATQLSEEEQELWDEASPHPSLHPYPDCPRVLLDSVEEVHFPRWILPVIDLVDAKCRC